MSLNASAVVIITWKFLKWHTQYLWKWQINYVSLQFRPFLSLKIRQILAQIVSLYFRPFGKIFILAFKDEKSQPTLSSHTFSSNVFYYNIFVKTKMYLLYPSIKEASKKLVAIGSQFFTYFLQVCWCQFLWKAIYCSTCQQRPTPPGRLLVDWRFFCREKRRTKKNFDDEFFQRKEKTVVEIAKIVITCQQRMLVLKRTLLASSRLAF